MTRKCECPEVGEVAPGFEDMYLPEEQSGMYHAPHECKGTHDMQCVRRSGVLLWLCSCCTMPGDIRVSKAEACDLEARVS